MKRFQQLIVEARGDRAPWEPFPDEQIARVANQLTTADVADMIDAMDELVREKSQTPAWDGDTCDDIARAQQVFAHFLAAVPANMRAAVDSRLQDAARETRDWLALAHNGQL